jgi:stage II sporulation protein D
LKQLQNAMTLTGKVVEPDANTVTLLANDFTILCELAGKNQTFHLQSQDDSFIRDESGRAFSGSIAIERPQTAARNGLSVTNQVSLETYIAALLPSEVADSCNIELLKTMAVVLRTEITRKLGCHSAEGYDICDKSHCHTYIGGATVTDQIRNAVDATAGQILTFEDRPIYTPYSMTNGSGTISAMDAFGKEIPYLPAIYTPWEKSVEWTVEFNPYELYQLLNAAGYTDIQGNVVSIEVKSIAEGSDYVTELSITDLFGNSVTVTGSEAIRILFAGRLPSANFVAGLSGENVKLIKRTVSDEHPGYTESEETITLQGTYGSFVFVGRGSGCGVGLSISGAMALAEMGKTYDTILECYFPGAVLTEKNE